MTKTHTTSHTRLINKESIYELLFLHVVWRHNVNITDSFRNNLICTFTRLEAELFVEYILVTRLPTTQAIIVASIEQMARNKTYCRRLLSVHPNTDSDNLRLLLVLRFQLFSLLFSSNGSHDCYAL